VKPRDASAWLLDLGGVLTDDVWQRMVLTPGEGLADRLGIDRQAAEAAGTQLWERYAVRPEADEDEYWRDLATLVGVPIPSSLVSETEQKLVRANPESSALVRALEERRARIGVLSNNTAFWYPKQARLAGIEHAVDPELVFLSFRARVTKEDVPGLFEVAANRVPALAATVVVDDQLELVRQARRVGFRAIHYPPDWSRSLVDHLLPR